MPVTRPSARVPAAAVQLEASATSTRRSVRHALERQMAVASGGLTGSSRQQQRPTSPDDRGQQDGGAGENAEYADRDGGVKRLRGADAGGGQSGAAGAGLRGCPSQAERQRCRSRSGAEEEERERDRIADSERAEEQEERHRAHDPAGGHEPPGL